MKLSVALREVSRQYFEGDPALDMRCGLCAAVDSVAHQPDPWEAAGRRGKRVMFEELGMDKDNPFGPELGEYQPTPREWEARAYMALFLAEYLEETGR